MESALPVMQQILSSVLQSRAGDKPEDPYPHSNVTGDPAMLSKPATLSSLLMTLFSFSALVDWLKLIIIGGILETCRRAVFSSYHKLMSSFFITAVFEEDDTSYDWMMFWLSRHPAWSTARDLVVSTCSFGLNSSAILLPGEDEDTSSLLKNARKLAYLPSFSSTHNLWYKGWWMSVTRIRKETGFYGRYEESLSICILSRSHRVLNELLLEAKRDYIAAQENNISIYVSDSNNSWRHVATRPKRPLKSIVLDPGVKDLLVDDARDFLSSKAWYISRGIPFRRGYLLHGAPGSGKTSIIHSLAGELGLDVYIVSLSRTGLDDLGLSELISELPEKCIALMEDIDAAFTQTLNRDEPDHAPADGITRPKTQATSKVSLSGLLNALDGVGAQEGRILFATTNKYASLDSALCRPGRMDLHIEFKLASKYQARELYRNFYLPDEDAKADSDDDKESVDSGYGSATAGSPVEKSGDALPTPLSSSFSEPTMPKITATRPSPPSPSETDNTCRVSQPHRYRTPALPLARVLELAAQFGDAIPEREFSMASLQGYLMGYKTRPLDAVKDVPAWIEGERLVKTSAGSPRSA